MTLEQCYEKLNGSYNEAIKHLMNEKLAETFSLKFLDDPTMEQLREAVKAGDIDGSFRAVHNLKGVAGNLAFTSLQKAASELTEQLRPREQPADSALMEKLEECYKTVCEALTAYKNEK